MKTIEKYYAIRIGTPGKHFTYFMTGVDGLPRLFINRKDAELECPKEPSTKVVKVKVTT